jgi:hypothetical protein
VDERPFHQTEAVLRSPLGPGSGTVPYLVVERDESWEWGVAGCIWRHVFRGEACRVLTVGRGMFEILQRRSIGCCSALGWGHGRADQVLGGVVDVGGPG